MLDAYIYEGLRTPFGRHGGSLAKVRPDDMLAGVMKDVMAKSKFKVEQVEDIVVGCGNQSGEDSRCVARHAGLAAGFPIEIPGTVLQRNCASGLGALADAAHS
ncbi:MAG: 3-oxoadipyl-CoA thiolase, partial [Betaproteobacteria bacterium]|nr:3-oxoadipyl-CoA thiolase [Betaproteobacteria bacterium]